MSGLNIDEAIELLNQNRYFGYNNWQHDSAARQGTTPDIVCFAPIGESDLSVPIKRLSPTEAIEIAKQYQDQS